jgi:hypothetical protein
MKDRGLHLCILRDEIWDEEAFYTICNYNFVETN